MVIKLRCAGVPALTMALVCVAAGALWAQTMSMGSGGNGMSMMSGMDGAEVPRVPPVAGYAEGERIFFIHTEVSDPEIGKLMTEMMGSPVPVVPAPALADAEMLARVWAFTNGVQPEGPRGPLGFQPDVFDAPAGSDGYTPLRRLLLLTRQSGSEPRLLTSAEQVEAAIRSGEVTEEPAGVVVNAPFLTWPGGRR